MKITLYHSRWCPRCRQASGFLEHIVQTRDDLEIERVDILHHPLQAWQAGIRMIPALTCGRETLSGLTLSREAILAFLAKHASPLAAEPK